MTKKNTLKKLCKDLLEESLVKCKKIDLEESVKQKQDKKYEFKNNIFNKEIQITKNDYSGGLIFGYKYSKHLGVFIEGKYNKYWNREWHGFSLGINYTIF